MRRAMLAHFLLASGVVAALFAMLAVFDQSWEFVYAWFGAALLSEAARSAFFGPSDKDDDEGVDTAHLNGGLDIVAVFCSTVFVPVIAMLHAGFLDGYIGIVVAVLMILTALYRLAYHNTASEEAQDNSGPPGPNASFSGMPACWGVIGFYLHAFDATPPVGILIVGIVIVLSLIPRQFPHILRSQLWRDATRVVVAGWLATAAYTLVQGFPAAPPVKSILLAMAVYAVVLTVLTPQPPNADTQPPH